MTTSFIGWVADGSPGIGGVASTWLNVAATPSTSTALDRQVLEVEAELGKVLGRARAHRRRRATRTRSAPGHSRARSRRRGVVAAVAELRQERVVERAGAGREGRRFRWGRVRRGGVGRGGLRRARALDGQGHGLAAELAAVALALGAGLDRVGAGARGGRQRGGERKPLRALRPHPQLRPAELGGAPGERGDDASAGAVRAPVDDLAGEHERPALCERRRGRLEARERELAGRRGAGRQRGHQAENDQQNGSARDQGRRVADGPSPAVARALEPSSNAITSAPKNHGM